jgi:hypothetical protein
MCGAPPFLNASKALPESGRIDRHQNGLPISDLLYPATCFLPFVPSSAGSICTTTTLAHTGRNLPWHCWREYAPRHEHTTATQAGPPMTLGNMRANGRSLA